jgi:hypothetical protein
MGSAPIAVMPSQFDSFEQRTGFALPPAVRDFFAALGGVEIASTSLKLLPVAESRRLLDNWPRYGFSCDRGYVPIAEEKNGDLFCVACAGDCRGQVFHLAWAGEEEMRFACLEDFMREHAVGG